jgi:thioredoxin 1
MPQHFRALSLSNQDRGEYFAQDVRSMAINHAYAEVEPRREEIDMLDGPIMLEFGSPWCGYCRAVQPLLAHTLAHHPRVRHIKIADASGRPLGRSFKVKLWPTLVFLSDGRETRRLVRPRDAGEIGKALALIDPVHAVER